MRAFPQHHIEQDERHFGVGGLLAQALEAQLVVHHGVEPADCELVLSEVEDRVRLALHGIREALFLLNRDVAVHRV